MDVTNGESKSGLIAVLLWLALVCWLVWFVVAALHAVDLSNLNCLSL